MEAYQPDAVVNRSDSVRGFNLSVKGHADCLRTFFSNPLMKTVAVAMNLTINCLITNTTNTLVQIIYTLQYQPKPTANKNTPSDLEKIRNQCVAQVSKMPHAPSVQFQTLFCSTCVMTAKNLLLMVLTFMISH
ncbi:hypothetical protein POM88_023507 [Heracleum sosnowskyi]|uniref:Uncharacterized protein n=1 Tax=Heracleum sosnowskyi TaxID=360622 RepID=A0AAD8MV06_9APIA|nr:hypothetical protein POM88_023507 [Heracleum sosnowskyi]